MKGIIVKDWDRVDTNSGRHMKYVFECLHHFLDSSLDERVTAQLQHFATKDDFPGIIYDLIKKFHFLPYIDTAAEAFFDIRNYTSDSGPNTEGFSIGDIKSGLTFDVIPDGQAVKVRKMAGVSERVGYLTYAGALGWNITLFKDRNWWQIEQNAIEFRNKYLQKKAQFYMALIEALASTNDVSWAAVTGSIANTNDNYEAIRDQNTINEAVLDLLTLNKDKYDVGPQTPLLLLAPLAIERRIRRALGPLNTGVSGAHTGVAFNIQTKFSLMMLTNQTDYYIGLPGLKSVVGNRENLTTYTEFDHLTRHTAASGWARWGGAIGDVDQIVRCKTA